MQVLNSEKVKVIGGKSWVSSKTWKWYANLDYKNKNGFSSNIFISEPSQDVISIIDTLDDSMGQEITLVTSIKLD